MFAKNPFSRPGKNRRSRLPIASSNYAIAPGKVLNRRYEIIQTLGSGGFSQIYLARDTHQPSQPYCAIKYFQPASSEPKFLQVARKLFQQEAQILEQLGNHPHIPQLLAYFEEKSDFFLVLEYIDGTLLADEISSSRSQSEKPVIQLLQEVLEILVFVHDRSVIHRDIKPANLIRRKSDNRLVLIDFGTIKQIQTQTTTVRGHCSATIPIGTQGYMAPEQGQGHPRPNSDLYALGIICVQMLTGLEPSQFQQDPNTGELCWQPQGKVRPELAAIIDKLVSYHFKDRYQSAREALEALQPLANGSSANVSVGSSGQVQPLSGSFSMSSLMQSQMFSPLAVNGNIGTSASSIEPPIDFGKMKWLLPGLAMGLASTWLLSSAIIDYQPSSENPSDEEVAAGSGENSLSSDGNNLDATPDSVSSSERSWKLEESLLPEIPSFDDDFSDDFSDNPAPVFVAPEISEPIVETQPTPKIKPVVNAKPIANPVEETAEETAPTEENLQRYRAKLTALIRQQFPLTPNSRENLRGLQRALGLSDDSAATIEQESIAAYKQDSHQYQEAFARAIGNQFPVSQDDLQQLQTLREELNLGENAIAALEQRATVAYEQNIQQYEAAVEVALTNGGSNDRAVDAIEKRVEERVAIARARRLQRYGEVFALALAQNPVVGDEARQRLSQLQHELVLDGESIATLEERVRATYLPKFQQYEDAVLGLARQFEPSNPSMVAQVAAKREKSETVKPSSGSLTVGSNSHLQTQLAALQQELQLTKPMAAAIEARTIGTYQEQLRTQLARSLPASPEFDRATRTYSIPEPSSAKAQPKNRPVKNDRPSMVSSASVRSKTPTHRRPSMSSTRAVEVRSKTSLHQTSTCSTDSGKSAVMSPDGRLLAGVSGGNLVKVWNCRTGELIRTMESPVGNLHSLSIRPDGRTLVGTSAKKAIASWNLHTGELLDSPTRV